MIIIANGKPREVLAESTVGTLLETLHLAPEQVVVEHNGEPLQRSRFGDTRLAPDDRIEIAQMVGGG